MEVMAGGCISGSLVSLWTEPPIWKPQPLSRPREDNLWGGRPNATGEQRTQAHGGWAGGLGEFWETCHLLKPTVPE